MRLNHFRRSSGGRRRGASGQEYGLGAGLVGAAALAALLATGEEVTCTLDNNAQQVGGANNSNYVSSCADAEPEPEPEPAPDAEITSVTPPETGDYAPGETLGFTVNYDRAVVNDATGVPSFGIDVGGTIVDAVFTGGYGSDELDFEAVLPSTAADADGIEYVDGVIDENGGDLNADNDGGDADLTFADTLSGITVGEDPYITNVDDDGGGNVNLGEEFTIVVDWSEDIFIDPATGTPQLKVVIGDDNVVWLPCVCGPYDGTTPRSSMTFSGPLPTNLGSIISDNAPISVGNTIRYVDGGGTVISGNGGNGIIRAVDNGGYARTVVPGGGTTYSGYPYPIVTDVIYAGGGGPYNSGDGIDFYVDHSAPVDVDVTNGTPYIEIDVDGTTRRAYYYDTDGNGRHTYRYIVGAGDYVDAGPSGIITIPGKTIHKNGCTWEGYHCVCVIPAGAYTLPGGTYSWEMEVVGDVAYYALKDTQAEESSVDSRNNLYLVGGTGNATAMAKVDPSNEVLWTHAATNKTGNDWFWSEVAAASDDSGAMVLATEDAGSGNHNAVGLRIDEISSTDGPLWEVNWTGGNFRAYGAANDGALDVTYQAVEDLDTGEVHVVGRNKNGTVDWSARKFDWRDLPTGWDVSSEVSGDLYRLDNGFLLHDGQIGNVARITDGGNIAWAKNLVPEFTADSGAGELVVSASVQWNEAQQLNNGDLMLVGNVVREGVGVDGGGNPTVVSVDNYGIIASLQGNGTVNWMKLSKTEFKQFTSVYQNSDGEIILHAYGVSGQDGVLQIDTAGTIQTDNDGNAVRRYPGDVAVFGSQRDQLEDVLINGTKAGNVGSDAGWFLWANTRSGCMSDCPSLSGETITLEDATLPSGMDYTGATSAAPGNAGQLIDGANITGPDSRISSMSQPNLAVDRFTPN